jgi:hypothetical protein
VTLGEAFLSCLTDIRFDVERSFSYNPSMSEVSSITLVFLALAAAVGAFAVFQRQVLRAIQAAKALFFEFSSKKNRLTRSATPTM